MAPQPPEAPQCDTESAAEKTQARSKLEELRRIVDDDSVVIENITASRTFTDDEKSIPPTDGTTMEQRIAKIAANEIAAKCTSLLPANKLKFISIVESRINRFFICNKAGEDDIYSGITVKEGKLIIEFEDLDGTPTTEAEMDILPPAGTKKPPEEEEEEEEEEAPKKKPKENTEKLNEVGQRIHFGLSQYERDDGKKVSGDGATALGSVDATEFKKQKHYKKWCIDMIEGATKLLELQSAGRLRPDADGYVTSLADLLTSLSVVSTSGNVRGAVAQFETDTSAQSEKVFGSHGVYNVITAYLRAAKNLGGNMSDDPGLKFEIRIGKGRYSRADRYAVAMGTGAAYDGEQETEEEEPVEAKKSIKNPERKKVINENAPVQNKTREEQGSTREESDEDLPGHIEQRQPEQVRPVHQQSPESAQEDIPEAYRKTGGHEADPNPLNAPEIKKRHTDDDRDLPAPRENDVAEPNAAPPNDQKLAAENDAQSLEAGATAGAVAGTVAEAATKNQKKPVSDDKDSLPAPTGDDEAAETAVPHDTPVDDAKADASTPETREIQKNEELIRNTFNNKGLTLRKITYKRTASNDAPFSFLEGTSSNGKKIAISLKKAEGQNGKYSAAEITPLKENSTGEPLYTWGNNMDADSYEGTGGLFEKIIQWKELNSQKAAPTPASEVPNAAPASAAPEADQNALTLEAKKAEVHKRLDERYNALCALIIPFLKKNGFSGGGEPTVHLASDSTDKDYIITNSFAKGDVYIRLFARDTDYIVVAYKDGKVLAYPNSASLTGNDGIEVKTKEMMSKLGLLEPAAAAPIMPASAPASAGEAPSVPAAPKQEAETENIETAYAKALAAALEPFKGKKINVEKNPLEFEFPYKEGNEIKKVPCKIKGSEFIVNGNSYDVIGSAGGTTRPLTDIEVKGTDIKNSTMVYSNGSGVGLLNSELVDILNALRAGKESYTQDLDYVSFSFKKKTGTEAAGATPAPLAPAAKADVPATAAEPKVDQEAVELKEKEDKIHADLDKRFDELREKIVPILNERGFTGTVSGFAITSEAEPSIRSSNLTKGNQYIKLSAGKNNYSVSLFKIGDTLDTSGDTRVSGASAETIDGLIEATNKMIDNNEKRLADEAEARLSPEEKQQKKEAEIHSNLDARFEDFKGKIESTFTEHGYPAFPKADPITDEKEPALRSGKSVNGEYYANIEVTKDTYIVRGSKNGTETAQYIHSESDINTVVQKTNASLNEIEARIQQDREAKEKEFQDRYNKAVDDALAPYKDKTIDVQTGSISFELPYIDGEEIKTTPCTIEKNTFKVNGNEYQIGFAMEAILKTITITGNNLDGQVKMATESEPINANITATTKQFIDILNVLRTGKVSHEIYVDNYNITFKKGG